MKTGSSTAWTASFKNGIHTRRDGGDASIRCGGDQVGVCREHLQGYGHPMTRRACESETMYNPKFTKHRKLEITKPTISKVQEKSSTSTATLTKRNLHPTTNPSTTMRAAKKLECSHTLFKKSPPLQSTSFLTFLYQTRTIQSGRRQLSSDHTRDQRPWIPFETDGQGTLSPQRLYGHQRQSTITNPEREAFRKLFNMVIKNPPRTSKGLAKQSDEELRTRYQQPEATEILENAAKAVRQSSPPEADNLERFPEPLRYMAAVANQKIQEQQRMKRTEEELSKLQTEAIALDDPVVKLQEAQHAHVEPLLHAARTDRDLWMVLEDHVFSVIRRLNLDGKGVQASPKSPNHNRAQAPRNPSNEQEEKTESLKTADISSNSNETEKPEQLAIIGPNYPSFLLIAIRQLRTHFPAWQTWSDFRKIDELLKEMDNSGLEFDENTLELLHKIKGEGERALMGKQGEVKRLWWNTEMVRSGWDSVVEWIPLIQERHLAAAVRLANESVYEASGES